MGGGGGGEVAGLCRGQREGLMQDAATGLPNFFEGVCETQHLFLQLWEWGGGNPFLYHFANLTSPPLHRRKSTGDLS